MYKCPSKNMGKQECLWLLLKKKGDWRVPHSSDSSFTLILSCVHIWDTNNSTYPLLLLVLNWEFLSQQMFFVCLQCISKDSPMTEQEVTQHIYLLFFGWQGMFPILHLFNKTGEYCYSWPNGGSEAMPNSVKGGRVTQVDGLIPNTLNFPWSHTAFP